MPKAPKKPPVKRVAYRGLVLDPHEVAKTMAQAVVEAEEAVRERRRAERVKRNRRYAEGRSGEVTDLRRRRGSLVAGTTADGWLGTDLGVLGFAKRERGQGKAARWGVWCPATNRTAILAVEAFRVIPPDELVAFREERLLGLEALERIGVFPGQVLEPNRVLVREGENYRFSVGPGDLLVSDPDGLPEPKAVQDTPDGVRVINARFYDDEDESEEYPPRDFAGLQRWREFAPPIVWCYALRQRLRLPFKAADIVPHAFDQLGLDRVVMPAGHRAFVLDLARMVIGGGHREGVNLLFYGPPGTGKTYTARMLAETMHRPLLTIDGRDLVGGPVGFEVRIRAALQRARNWGAVVLFDEADILLGSRDGMSNVAYTVALLRLLEHHGGVVVLTSNRPFAIDPAFESRINARLHFPALPAAARAKVWTRALEGKVAADNGDAQALAAVELDGREIQLAMTNAEAEAYSRTEPISLAMVIAHARRLSASREQMRRVGGDKELGFGRRPSADGAPSWD